MSIPTTTPQRQRRNMSPTSRVTPSRSASNFSGYSPTVTSGTNSGRVNIVTRVALEGKAKHSDDGASIKMYLKLAIPLDSVTPGTTIPLFPEENVKVLSSQVHPLDGNSTPYNFSSTVSPLLHRAARALSLPARSSTTFQSTFSISHSPIVGSSSRMSKSEDNPEMIPPVDEVHSGHILVSGYNVSYVLPKFFPQAPEHKEEVYSRPSRRRLSISERNTVQFMAAIDMWVPYASRPPRSPFLLSLPTPRCLHNQIKLRIYPPNQSSNSYASLSSIDDEGGSWDLTADPQVARSSTNRLTRTNSYSSFADDESSDSSTVGFPDGCGIQGTFPSTERIRVRWAKPSKALHVPEGGRIDGRRRVGVKAVKGEMTCTVRGWAPPLEEGQHQGLLMDVEYKGTCSGVWFPGVATMLGMDVGLEAKGSEISWAPGHSTQWKVTGGNGYTGVDVGPTSTVPTASRASSFESNTSTGHVDLAVPKGMPDTSAVANASLLRAPLPTKQAAELSFEGSNSSLGSNNSMSTVPSLSISAPPGFTQHAPGTPVTLHLNINDLIPPAKNVFTFTISGTIVVTPKPSLSRLKSATFTDTLTTGLDLDPVMLPKFTVLAADSESTTTVIRHEAEAPNAVIEVYRPTGDIYRDAQAKKTVLRRAGMTKCGEEGGRIALKVHDPFAVNGVPVPSLIPRTPLGQRKPRSTHTASHEEPEPWCISNSTMSVFFLTRAGSSPPDCYGVRFKLPIPNVPDVSFLEFGLASSQEAENTRQPTRIRDISATLEGTPVRVQASDPTKMEKTDSSTDFESAASRRWVSWVKIDLVPRQHGELIVEYVIGPPPLGEKGKGKAINFSDYDILLPTFPTEVKRLDITIEDLSDPVISVTSTNMEHQVLTSNAKRLVHHRLPVFFTPRLILAISRKPMASVWRYSIFSCVLILLALVGVMQYGAGIRMSASNPIPVPPARAEIPPVVIVSTEIVTTTLTMTVLATTTTTHHHTVTGQLEASASTSIATTSSKSLELPSLAPLPVTSSAASSSSMQSDSPEHSPMPPSINDFDARPPTPSKAPPSSPEPDIPSLLESALDAFRPTLRSVWMARDSETFKESCDTARRTLAVVWKFVRKAYHYPLEAP